MDRYLIKFKSPEISNSMETVCSSPLPNPNVNVSLNNESISKNSIEVLEENPVEGNSARPVKITGRKFQENWKKTYPWILYEKNKVFCSVCKTATEYKVSSLSSRDRETIKAFVSEGFCAWNKAIYRFKNHEKSNFHKHAVITCSEIKKGTNVHASLSDQKSKEMKDSREALLAIISSALFLAKQGLAIRGHDDENSNLIQLLSLRSEDVPSLKIWLQRTKFKWISHDIQNEILDILAKNVQYELLSEIKKAGVYSIIMDETTDITTKEQASICFRIADESFKIHEIFMGFYETPSITSESLFSIVKDVLSRFNLQINNCRGQCYDGAPNVSGNLSGLQTRILSIEPRAIFVHCFAHTLNLVVQDTMNKVTMVRDFITLVRELINFVKGSPKRLNIFQEIQASSEDYISLRPFCPTRWCLRISSISSLEKNYEPLIEFFEDIQKEAGDVGAKASGFLKKMQEFEFFLLIKIVIFVFRQVEVLNAGLQKASLTFYDADTQIQSVLKCIEMQRSDEVFESLYSETVKEAANLALDDPVLPRQRKIPRKIADGSEPHNFKSPEERYRQLFFQVMDNAANSLKIRFSRTTMNHLSTVESFILNKNKNAEDIVTFYGSDFNQERLCLHRDMFWDIAKAHSRNIGNMTHIIDFLSEKESISIKFLIPEFIKLINFILTLPVTSCSAERSFSTLRRLKTYLRSTMKQNRLNNVAILHIHKDIATKLNLDVVADEFIKKTQIRLNTFYLKK